MIEYSKDATPLDYEELKGLKLPHITNREELDFWEAQNIAQAQGWAQSLRQKDFLNPKFICTAHKKMFSVVWTWAGKYRKTEKNIGALPHLIETQVHSLCDDAKAWVEYNSYDPDEIAARFHHCLVAIHPFPNGNGRHARFTADLILKGLFKKTPFSWGGRTLVTESETRQTYIQSLKAADDHDYSMLLAFVRS